MPRVAAAAARSDGAPIGTAEDPLGWALNATRHLYVHIPFCRTRCGYCDFAAEAVGPHLRNGRVTEYVRALRTELTARVGSLDLPLETIYVGGGTPTVVPPADLLPLVADLAALQRTGARSGGDCADRGGRTDRSDREFTIEANPGTIDAELLTALRAAGVTRLSLGVQSFSPALRAALGRRVSQDEIEGALSAIAAVGWQDWNLDLVFGIPGQDWAAAAADVEAAVAAGPTHISLYDLTYTAGFVAAVDRRLGAAARSAAAAVAEEHYAGVVALLEEAGYGRYEVSNYARPGWECRHNLAYWQGADYVGVGAAAVSTVGEERRTNPASVAGYLAGEEASVERLSPRTRLWEQAMLGLRTREGVDEQTVAAVLDQGALTRLLEQGCVERCCGKLRVNAGYMDVSSSVLASILLTPDTD